MIRILKSFHRTIEYITHDDRSNGYIVLLDKGKWCDQCFEGSYAECLDYVRASPTEQEESEHGPVVEYRQDAYNDIIVYADGYEERFYIGD